MTKFNEQRISEIDELRTKLSKETTLGGMLNILTSKYDLDKVQVGAISNPIYTGQFLKLLKTFNPEKK